MLTITVPAKEAFNGKTFEFATIGKSQTLKLEHSLLSISKWESKWKRSFLNSGGLTPQELIDYVKCMTITQNVPDYIYDNMTVENKKDIDNYIYDSQTATTINQTKSENSKDVITSELIYYWMVSFNIPFECQKWHLNRLLMLINVCNIKNQPKKKMTKSERASMAKKRRAEVARRRSMYNTNG